MARRISFTPAAIDAASVRITGPRETIRRKQMLKSVTVARAHELYMVAVPDGRSSSAKRRNKPRTIADRLRIYAGNIAPTLGAKMKPKDVGLSWTLPVSQLLARLQRIRPDWQ